MSCQSYIHQATVPPFLFQLDPAPQKFLVLICRSPYFWKQKKPPKLVGFERDDDVPFLTRNDKQLYESYQTKRKC